MKDKVQLAIMLASISLVGVLVSLCGIGLSLGMRKLSLVSFFGVIAFLILLRMIGRAGNEKAG